MNAAEVLEIAREAWRIAYDPAGDDGPSMSQLERRHPPVTPLPDEKDQTR